MKVKKDKHNFIIHLKDPKKIVRNEKKEDDYSSEDEKDEGEEERNLEMSKQLHLCGSGGVNTSTMCQTHPPARITSASFALSTCDFSRR